MPSVGTKARRVRSIDDATWEDFKAACVDMHGTDNRSDVIRTFVEQTVAEWRDRQEQNGQ